MDNERIAYLEIASGLQSVVNVWDLIEAAKQIEAYVSTPVQFTKTATYEAALDERVDA